MSFIRGIGTGREIQVAQITFVTDGTGRATELILHEGGTDLHLNRIR